MLCLLAAGVAQDASARVGRAVLAFQAWYATRSLPGVPLQAGHFRVWVIPSGGAGATDLGRAQSGGKAAEGWPMQSGEVLAQLERAYARVTADLGVEPEGAVPVVLHPDEASLERYAGGLAAASSGVYRGGVIHLVYRGELSGPAAHELTHYLLEAVAPGRVPRWFQEGLAQLEELRLAGPVPYRPAPAPFASWRRLERDFTRLPDEVAYRASLSAVSFLYHQGGHQALRRLMLQLATGRSFAAAVRVAWGRSPGELERQWSRSGEG